MAAQLTLNVTTLETSEDMTLCDWTGVVEMELFVATYRNFGLATARYPVLEVVAKVEPYENSRDSV